VPASGFWAVLDTEGFWQIVGLSLGVSLTATSLATLAGTSLGAALAVRSFPGRHPLVILTNAFLGLPPVVVGLALYLLLSRSGPVGVTGLLFTPIAMVLAQFILATPIVTALVHRAVETAWTQYGGVLMVDGASRLRAVPHLLAIERIQILVAVLAGFGRTVSEVGAILIVGGNIAGYTRTITTTIDRRQIAWNDFIVVGPRSDPAHIAGGHDAVVALTAIAGVHAPFVSRGDKSGTDALEHRLWRTAEIDPAKAGAGSWYRNIGAGMGAALNTASAMGAYTLSDRGTWLSFGNKGELAVLIEGDPRLLNRYDVILLNPQKHPEVKQEPARRLADWLTSFEGQAAIAEYQINGEQLFHPSARTPK